MSTVDTLAFTDQVVDEVSKVRGIDVLPLNRTLEAMRALDMGRVASIGDAINLARMLDVDGLIAGSVTAYDPYSPPKLGLALQLFLPEHTGPSSIDISQLETAARENSAASDLSALVQPVSGVAEVVDAQDNDVVLHLQQYAVGRSNPNTSLGWRRYLVDFDLYTHYVSYRLLDRLLSEEARRISQNSTATADATAPSSARLSY